MTQFTHSRNFEKNIHIIKKKTHQNHKTIRKY